MTFTTDFYLEIEFTFITWIRPELITGSALFSADDDSDFSNNRLE